MVDGTSPASSGPAGSHFEGQVGAFYLLSLLVGAEPRGLPGTIIDRVSFQRAAEGYPLDDVIVHAHDSLGKSAILEIQVKRGITFAPADVVFRSVVGQIAEVSRKPEFLNSRYELGIAISRTSKKIDGAYQDVLTWARQLGDATTFVNRINRPGSAQQSMRDFVNTFRTHLREAEAEHDDATVWQLLRRLQIFVFDFTARGSASEELAKERAVRALHPEDAPRAAGLWAELTELAIKIASSGGDRARDGLIADLAQKSFRLSGQRHNLTARLALAEASRHTLADMNDRVCGVTLTRHEHVASVHDALDSGRYVEIRGDAGVGKSGVMKHFAEQISAEAEVIVLSPSRIVPKGWLAMRAVLGFDGIAHDVLSELAGSGSGVIFVDSLDFYGEEERLTVIDLIREAARIPGMSVIATARRDFGVAEASWLPADALDQLGRAKPVIVGELSDAETDELRNAAPQLIPLLADNHPARPVARNLFRLSRLAAGPSDGPMPRTEVEMAEQWWQTADGARDETHRDRTRVLTELARQALSRVEQLSVRDLPAAAVDALVISETLRDLRNDRVSFRHDVLREWAIANLLFYDPEAREKLPLARNAPADLARGTELAARMAIERADAERWHSFFGILRREAVNESWSRAALLALVRSEIATETLEKASAYLLAGRGVLLRDLIRIVMAVESEPAAKRFAAAGIDLQFIPAGLTVPNWPTWLPLIIWLLKLGANLPASAIPDVVDLYSAWAMGFLGKDATTPYLVPWFHRWLMEIETGREGVRFEDQRRPFNGELTPEQIGKLATDLRTNFLAFSNHTPKLAADYLRSLRRRRYNDEALNGIIKFRGALAQAAPKELSELTLEYLMRQENDEDGPFREPFGHRDLDFVPASPAQGPFFELLLHAPEQGLSLIRQLVDHAISFMSGGQNFGVNAIRMAMPDGSERVFPWYESYSWSRDLGAGPSAIASALMALEAWAHNRVDAGESIDKVLADVIGRENAPAAYLLVAVDLLLSHWPKSRKVAIPFLASPELLCLDRERLVADNMRVPDIFVLNSLQREPVGLATLDSLKARPSRRHSLDELLTEYPLDESKEDRDLLAELLRRAVSRLGPAKKESTLRDPDFMVIHALNLIDPINWQKRTVQGKDGPVEGWEYVAPVTESEHLKPLQDAARERQVNAGMQSQITIALNKPGQPLQFVAAVVAWAQWVVHQPCEGETEQWIRDKAIVTAAMIAARDGDADLLATHAAWARDILKRGLKAKNDPVHRTRSGLQFNPIAIAFVGIVFLMKNSAGAEDIRTILETAGDDNPAAAQGLSTVAAVLADIDERLPRAVLRCAFAACVQPHRSWDRPEEEYLARCETHRREVEAVVAAELAWLSGMPEEPEWPQFELRPAHPRHCSSVVNRRAQRQGENVNPELYTDHQAAALWLGNTANIFDVVKRPWLRDIVRAYSRWTNVANGSELDEGDDADHRPTEWNNAYFNLLAHCLPGLPREQMHEIALAPICGLPDEAFLDVMTVLLRSVDAVYFDERGLQGIEAVHIRSVLAEKLMKTRDWEWQRRNHSKSISMNLAPALAVLLFNDYGRFQPSKCYLNAKGIDRLDPFLPLLQQIAETGPFLFLAIFLLNLLEVSPRPTHLPLIVAAGKGWLASNPDDRVFWIDHSVGRRLCSVMEAVFTLDPKLFGTDQPLRNDIDSLLSGLVRLGVPEAHALENSVR